MGGNSNTFLYRVAKRLNKILDMEAFLCFLFIIIFLSRAGRVPHNPEIQDQSGDRVDA